MLEKIGADSRLDILRLFLRDADRDETVTER